MRQHYRDFLNRDPDPPGFAFWTSEYDARVNACNPIANAQEQIRCRASARASISLSFFLAVEYQETGYLVYRTHDVAFGRVGTPRPARGANVSQLAATFENYLFDAQMVARGIVVNEATDRSRIEGNTAAFYNDFVQRPAFIAKYPMSLTAEQYIDALFASADLTSSASERQSALNAYGTGGTEGRAAALRAIVRDDQVFQREFNRAFAFQLYGGYLRRDPDIPGYNFWLNKLDFASGEMNISRDNVSNDPEAIGRVRRAEMIEAFIRSCEYQRRFGQPTVSPNDSPVSVSCSGM